ncbi:MAG TPA: hypothetical protein VMU67_04595 [Steroidobacteraceae bacterium]|nr:hypothetical protein [Steroidobacteraceae bacterium]
MTARGLLKLSQISAVVGCVTLIAGLGCALALGAGRVPHLIPRAEALSMPFFVTAAVGGLKYSTRHWNGRPEKRLQLRMVRLLAILLIVVAIPVMVLNWIFD